MTTATDPRAYYLRSVPEAVQRLTEDLSDGALLMAWEAVSEAHSARPTEAIEIPRVGMVEPDDLHTVWGWILDLVKARHVEEWHALSDAKYAQINARAAEMQGATNPERIDWNALTEDQEAELFDGQPSALDLAVQVLSEHAVKELFA